MIVTVMYALTVKNDYALDIGSSNEVIVKKGSNHVYLKNRGSMYYDLMLGKLLLWVNI